MEEGSCGRLEELSAVQRRTIRDLIGEGSAPAYSAGLAEEVRDDLERRIAEALGPDRELDASTPSPDPIWIGKRRLNQHDRCEGLLHADVRQEDRPFEHSHRTASGALFHKAIELDLVTERSLDPRSVSDRAADRLVVGDASFAVFWRLLDSLARAEVLAEAGRRLALFRDSFPPFPRRWASQPELRMRMPLAGGRVVLTGTPDLVLGRRRRLILDLKSGMAWPEYPEDLRFYALLALLRTGVPPYRVATFFLDSGQWQAEDVSREGIQRAADRVVLAVASVGRLRAGGEEPALSPGRHCERCPRQATCPALRAEVA